MELVSLTFKTPSSYNLFGCIRKAPLGDLWTFCKSMRRYANGDCLDTPTYLFSKAVISDGNDFA